MAVKIDWTYARLDYERGMSQAEVARRHGVTRRAIQKHIEREGWTQDLRAAIARSAEEKVIGIKATDDLDRREQLLSAEATKRAEVIKRQRAEWDYLRTYIAAVLNEAATVKGGRMVLAKGFTHHDALRHIRFAKLAVETLRTRHEAERIAFGLDQPEDAAGDPLSDEHAAIRIMQILNAAATRESTPRSQGEK